MHGEVRALPLGVSVLVGGLDGVIRQGDVSTSGPKPWWTQNSTYFEAASLGVGLALGMFGRFHADVTEPLLYTSTALLAAKVGNWGAKGFPKTGATTPAGAAMPAMAELAQGAGGYAAPQLFGRIRQEPVGLTG